MMLFHIEGLWGGGPGKVQVHMVGLFLDHVFYHEGRHGSVFVDLTALVTGSEGREFGEASVDSADDLSDAVAGGSSSIYVQLVEGGRRSLGQR
jgi:hypothetical protein